jgi:aldose sugar dehydrogenase
MHLFAQLAFGSVWSAPRGYAWRMNQLRSFNSSSPWLLFGRMLGRGLTLMLLLISLVSVGMVACGGGGGGDPAPAAPVQTVQPVVTGSPGSSAGGGGNANAAAMLTSTFSLQVTELNTSLSSPWGLAFLPDGRMLVTEKGGTLKLLAADGSTVGTVSGVPAVNSSGQGGLLDVVIDPAFASNQRIYMTFSENDSANTSLSGTAVARAKLDAATRALSDVTIIYRQTPKVASSGHFGSRMVFDKNGYLFVALGDRQSSSQRVFSQDLTRGNGKVMRISTEGMPAPGNPSFATAGAQSAIWSYGHRNPQGAALHPTTGELWLNEHGPQGGDEINRVEAGKNYGWPVISYGQEYGSTTQVGEGTAKAGMEQPVSYWLTRDGSAYSGGSKSSIAPSGMVIYSGNKFPEFSGNIFNGALAGAALWRIVLGGADGKTEVFRERLLGQRGERIRDVRQGPDGWIYLLTDNGKLLRVSK